MFYKGFLIKPIKDWKTYLNAASKENLLKLQLLLRYAELESRGKGLNPTQSVLQARAKAIFNSESNKSQEQRHIGNLLEELLSLADAYVKQQLQPQLRQELRSSHPKASKKNIEDLIHNKTESMPLNIVNALFDFFFNTPDRDLKLDQMMQEAGILRATVRYCFAHDIDTRFFESKPKPNLIVSGLKRTKAKSKKTKSTLHDLANLAASRSPIPAITETDAAVSMLDLADGGKTVPETGRKKPRLQP